MPPCSMRHGYETLYLLVIESGRLYAWGFNFYEQLGLGDSERDYDAPVRLAVTRAKQVACGYFHTAALID